MKKYILLLLVTVYTNFAFTQSNLNSYKYVVISEQFPFQKSENQFQINALTKFLLEKEGFEVYYTNATLPNELATNNCLDLEIKMHKNSTPFITKINFDLVNCKNEVIFSSQEGRSREKQYKKAYNDAIRMAFNSLKAKGYNYDVSLQSKETPIATEEVLVANMIPKLIKTQKIIVVEKKSQNEGKPLKNMEILYAQAIENGFQLVDKTPKIVYSIQKTNLENVFLVQNKNAILYKKDDFWVLEYYQNNILKQTLLTLKF